MKEQLAKNNWHYNPNCPNKHCEGGIITYDGQTGRLCKKCNPSKNTNDQHNRK